MAENPNLASDAASLLGKISNKLDPAPTDASSLLGKISNKLDPAPTDASSLLGKISNKLDPAPTDASSLLGAASETAVKIDFVPTDTSALVGKWGDLTADSNKLDAQVPTDASALLGTNGSLEGGTEAAVKLSPVPTDASSITGKLSDPAAPSPADAGLNTGLNAGQEAPLPSGTIDAASGPVPDASFHASTEPLLQGDPLVQAAALGALGNGGGTDDAVIDPNDPFPLGSPFGQQPAVIDPNNPFPFGSPLGQPIDPTFDPNLVVPIAVPGSGNPYSPGFLVGSEVNPHRGLPGPAPTPTDVSALAGSVGGSGPTDPGVVRADGLSTFPPVAPPQTFATGAARDAAGPAHVHGYVAFVDPGTGAEYLPHQANGLGTSIAPGAVTLRFQGSAGEIRDVPVGGGGYWYREAVRQVDGSISTRAANSGGLAWYYDVQLNLDDAPGDPRADYTGLTPGNPALAAVVYNPQRWQFVEVVSVGPAAGSGTGVGQVFTRRAAPFADLPDPRL